MPHVIVRGFGSIRDIIGSERIKLEINEKETLTSAINSILATYHGISEIVLDPETGKPRTNIRFLLNERNVELPKDAEQRVEDGDVLAILPPVGGG